MCPEAGRCKAGLATDILQLCSRSVKRWATTERCVHILTHTHTRTTVTRPMTVVDSSASGEGHFLTLAKHTHTPHHIYITYTHTTRFTQHLNTHTHTHTDTHTRTHTQTHTHTHTHTALYYQTISHLSVSSFSQSLHHSSRSEERRVGKECRSPCSP